MVGMTLFLALLGFAGFGVQSLRLRRLHLRISHLEEAR